MIRSVSLYPIEMKYQTFFCLCLVVTYMTGAYAQKQTAPVTGGAPKGPGTEVCAGGKGLLDSVGNLAANLLANVEGVLGAITKLPNGLHILNALRGLLELVRNLVNGLLGGLGHGLLPGLLHGHLETVIQSVTSLLDGVLGKGKGTALACTPAGGVGGLSGLSGILDSVLGILNTGSKGLPGLPGLTTLPGF